MSFGLFTFSSKDIRQLNALSSPYELQNGKMSVDKEWLWVRFTIALLPVDSTSTGFSTRHSTGFTSSALSLKKSKGHVIVGYGVIQKREWVDHGWEEARLRQF
ncbi:unnamed protein product [Caretta caretta]